MGAPSKYSLKAGCLSFVSNYIEETVPFENIRYIKAQDKVCSIHVKGFDPFETYIPLSKLYDQLPKDLFIKVNRSCIVSIEEVASINKHYIYLRDRTKISIAEQHYDDIKKCHEEYLAALRTHKDDKKIEMEISKYHLLDISPVPTFVIEMIFEDDTPVDFKFKYVNKAGASLFNVDDKDKLLGKTYNEVFSDKDKLWINFYSPTALTGISRNIVAKSNPIEKELYVRCYQPFYLHVVSLMQDAEIVRSAFAKSHV